MLGQGWWAEVPAGAGALVNSSEACRALLESGLGFSGRSPRQGTRAAGRALHPTFGAEKLKTGLQHPLRRQGCMQSLRRWGQQARPEGASLSSVLQSEPQKQSSVLTAEFVKGCESRMKLKKGTSVGSVSEKVRD